MRIVAVIPVKSLATGKSRLQSALDPQSRAQLVRTMFERVLAAVCAAGLPALVVSGDAALREAAAARGCATLIDDGAGGLNDAIGAGRDSALLGGADGLLVLPADLPCIAAPDVVALVAAAAGSPALVIAPDGSDSGTNALLVAPPQLIPFAFGPDSYRRHCAAGRAAGVEPAVVRRPGLALDIDTAEDLRRWQALAAR